MASNSGSGKLVLGYWAIRGLGEPIRMTLQYRKVPYEEKSYVQGEGPEFSRENWLKEKYTLGLDFPNIPYLVDGDLKMTQSKPILFYLGRKLGLMGKNPAEEAKIMMLCDEAHDLRFKMSTHFYGPEGDSAQSRKDFYEANVRETLQHFDAYLAKSSSKFAVGDSATVADFQLFEYLDVAFLMDGTGKAPTDFPHINAFLNHIRNLPELKDHISKAQATLATNNKSSIDEQKIFIHFFSINFYSLSFFF